MATDKITYQNAGVDPEKAAGILSRFARSLKNRPKDPSLLAGIGPFAACYALGPSLQGMKEPLLVTSCDGVGTKVKLALEWNKIDTLGQDLVAMNVNDILCVGAKPLIFLDYYACGNLRDAQLTTLLESIQAGCEIAECSLAGGETAEMPGMYSGDDFDLAGFTVGIVDRPSMFSPERVKVGDRLIAIASTGLHSNGYSLVRKLVERAKLDPNAKAPFEGGTWKEILLRPTQIYVKALKPVLAKLNAAAHITGGGLFENLPRVLPQGTRAHVRKAQWPIPPLFQWVKETAGISDRELLSTVNAGVGMILIASAENAPHVLSDLQARGEKSWEIGTVEKSIAGEDPTVLWG